MEDRTIGDLFYNGTVLCKTLELPWKNNKRDESCIPIGIYKCIYDPHIDKFLVLDVPDRDNIQIHVGNSLKDTTGCITVGKKYDSNWNLVSSRIAFNRIYDAIGTNVFKLYVVSFEDGEAIPAMREKPKKEERLAIVNEEIKKKPFYKQEGFKRGLGTALMIIGEVVKKYNAPVGEIIVIVGSIIGGIGIINAASKSNPKSGLTARIIFAVKSFIIKIF